MKEGVREYHERCIRMDCYWANPLAEKGEEGGLTQTQRLEHSESVHCLLPQRC